MLQASNYNRYMCAPMVRWDARTRLLGNMDRALISSTDGFAIEYRVTWCATVRFCDEHMGEQLSRLWHSH